MPASKTQETVHEALVRIQKDLKAPKSHHNKFGNFNYRSTEDILEAVKPLLNGCVLTITDTVEQIGDRYYVRAAAKIENSTESIWVQAYAREQEEQKGMSAPQVTGSTSSYARKYALSGLFAIDDEKDSDTMDNTVKQIEKIQQTEPDPTVQNQQIDEILDKALIFCPTCGMEATEREGVSKTTGKKWKALFCSTGDKTHTKFL